MDEKEYRKRWEDSLEERLKRLDETQCRTNGHLAKLEAQQKVQYTELHELAHDANKGIKSIGAKMDALKDALDTSNDRHFSPEMRAEIMDKWATLSEFADRYRMIKIAIWGGIISGIGVMLFYGIRNGIIT